MVMIMILSWNVKSALDTAEEVPDANMNEYRLANESMPIHLPMLNENHLELINPNLFDYKFIIWIVLNELLLSKIDVFFHSRNNL